MSQEIWLWWSSGKDSAWARGVLGGAASARVTRLVTTFTCDDARVAVREIPLALLDALRPAPEASP